MGLKRKILKWGGLLFAIFLVWIGSLFLADTIIKLRVPVSLPPKNISFTSDYVAIRGTWVIEGEKPAFPLQTIEVNCFKSLHTCFSATAQVMFGNLLTATTEQYEVIEWNNYRLIYVNDSPLCVQYFYTIDNITKSANGVRIKKKNTTTDCSDLQNELRLSLEDGFKIHKDLEDKAAPWFLHSALLPLKLFID